MEKRAAILSAALKLLTEKGIHATPMSAIAKEAGTGMGTIYNYFPNKEILINELYVNIKKLEREIFADFDEEKPLKTQFEDYYTCAVAFFLKNGLFFQLAEQLQASPILTQSTKDVGYQAMSPVLELIEKGKKRRIIKDISTIELTQFIGGTLMSFLRLHFRTDIQHEPSLSKQLKMVWDAIKE
ncbi:MAG: TetR/AcrR family transcriptional regulator [Saprospiraceae bacterium]